jgi:hypothetical protein
MRWQLIFGMPRILDQPGILAAVLLPLIDVCPKTTLGPGDADFSTTDFCVMKYEAKYDNKGAASFAIGIPARNHDQGRAASACRNLGPGYALINNAEWMTLASNAANVGTNWSSGTVGTGALNRGHSDNAPADALAAVTDDNDPCNGTGQTCSASTWHDQRRTHELPNSNVIWDLAGNVWEWVDSYNRDNKPTPATAAWYEFTAITGSTVMPKTMLVPTTAVKAWWSNSWNGATNGIGQMYPGAQNSGGRAVSCWLLELRYGFRPLPGRSGDSPWGRRPSGSGGPQ